MKNIYETKIGKIAKQGIQFLWSETVGLYIAKTVFAIVFHLGNVCQYADTESISLDSEDVPLLTKIY